MFLVFFFKQKTAYEMRISDWSSDVCSSDLYEKIPLLASANLWGDYQLRAVEGFREARQDHFASLVSIFHIVVTGRFREAPLVRELMSASDKRSVRAHYRESLRSEEHTSELQSLMRISYAVFCLTKKSSTHIGA